MAMLRIKQRNRITIPPFDITNFFSIVISRAVIMIVVKICKASIE